MNFTEALHEILDDLYFKRNFRAEDGAGHLNIDLNMPLEYEILSGVTLYPKTHGYPKRYIMRAEATSNQSLLLSYGFEGSTYHDVVMFTDKLPAEQPLCKLCLMCHDPRDTDHPCPVRVQQCTPEELRSLVFARVDHILEMADNNDDVLDFAQIRGILEGAASLWQSRKELCVGGDNIYHGPDCNSCYKVTVKSGVVAPQQYEIELNTPEDHLIARGWCDLAGWRIDSLYTQQNNDQLDHVTWRFEDAYDPERASVMQQNACSGSEQFVTLSTFDGAARLALLSKYFFNELADSA